MENLQNSQTQNVTWYFGVLEDYVRLLKYEEYQESKPSSEAVSSHRIQKKQTIVEVAEDSERMSKRQKNVSSPPSTPELTHKGAVPEYNILLIALQLILLSIGF